jgi:hypothetical protein
MIQSPGRTVVPSDAEVLGRTRMCAKWTDDQGAFEGKRHHLRLVQGMGAVGKVTVWPTRIGRSRQRARCQAIRSQCTRTGDVPAAMLSWDGRRGACTCLLHP